MSSTKNTAKKLSGKESPTVYWMPPLFLGILEDSSQNRPGDYNGRVTPSSIREWLMLLQQDSPVSPSRLPENRGESQIHGICGRPPGAVLASYDHDTFSWRTCQISLFTDILDEYSETWPKWGMIVNGELSVLTMPERLTGGNGCGLWPTPRVSDTEGGIVKAQNDGNGWFRENAKGERWEVKLKDAVDAKVKQYPTPQTRDYRSGKRVNSESPYYQLNTEVTKETGEGQLNPDWTEWLQGWPIGWSDLEPLTELIWLSWETDPADGEIRQWATPNVCGNYNRKGASATSGDGLATQVREEGNGTGSIPRVTTEKKNRINRLKAIGNGQVPQCVAMAWEVLGDKAD